MQYKLIVFGASYGGMNALKVILKALPQDFPLPVVIVQHISPNSDKFMINQLDTICKLVVKEAEEKELLKSGVAYFAPPDYHLLIEDDMTLSLSVEDKINYSRPAIDVLFESAAYALGHEVIGVILTGANNDGSIGLKRINENGGLTIVQSPETAQASTMPQGAIETVSPDHILPLGEIASFLVKLFI